ncbi:MAG: orotidine 5'-phosphate decarboxylase [Candidatus Altiarchaeota archaeon]|nr:orotidine 5'-phosphate decarboxylase [Candidatus Altiarchaeota archaeon]
MKPVLQVALDFIDMERALKIAEEVQKSVDWLEVGTPLIKSAGMDSVRMIKEAYPNKTIVADLKIADVGDVETEMAAKSGADVVTVLGNVDDQTILHSIEASKNYGCKVMVDLLNVPDIAKRAKEAEELGADYVMVHTGIDQQMVEKDLFGRLAEVSKSVSIPVAVGGGITLENVGDALKNGAGIIIVGGTITKSPKASEVAERFKLALGKGVNFKTEKKERDVVSLLSEVSTSNLSDAMHRRGEMNGIGPIVFKGKIVGKAYTVRAYPGDWSKTVQAIDKAEKGDIIVIDAHASQVALWGGLASRSAKSRGIAGLVIDGAVRDIEEIEELGFPVYARHVSPTAGEPKGLGELNVPIKCGGAEIEPGDYIVADQNGVVVIPKKRALEIANRALYVKEKEDRVKKEIDEGKTLGRILELGKWEKVC